MQSRHKGGNGLPQTPVFHSGTGRGGLRRRQGAGEGGPSTPCPAPISCQGRWPVTVAEARVLTLLILCLPMPLTPVPYGSQSDNMTHDYQGGKQAARRLHGCHTEWAEPSSPETSCCEVRQHLPAWRVSEEVPQNQSPLCLLLPCLQRQSYCTICTPPGDNVQSPRHQLRSHPASSQPPPSRGSWPLPTRTPHRAQLSCLYAEPRRSRLTGALTLAYPQPHPPGGGACSSSPQASAPQPSLGRLNTGPPSQVKPNQHSLPTSGSGLNAQSTSKGALWEQPPSTEGGQMSMRSPLLPSLQLTPPTDPTTLKDGWAPHKPQGPM